MELSPGTPAGWFFRMVEGFLGHTHSHLLHGRDPAGLTCNDARDYVILRDNRACAVPSCRRSGELTVHHILPWAWGGTHHPAHLVTLCSICHRNLCRFCTREVSRREPFPPPDAVTPATVPAGRFGAAAPRPVLRALPSPTVVSFPEPAPPDIGE